MKVDIQALRDRYSRKPFSSTWDYSPPGFFMPMSGSWLEPACSLPDVIVEINGWKLHFERCLPNVQLLIRALQEANLDIDCLLVELERANAG